MKRRFMSSKNRFIFVVAVVLLAILVILWAERVGERTVAEAVVTFDLDTDMTFHCELADTEAERAKGLMDRGEMDADKGMLFMFDNVQNVSFWMKNTLIPLDIVFIGENLTVVNIAEALPEPGVSDYSLTIYRSAGPVKWVLEINKGICSENGIVSGTHVAITIN